MLLLALKLVLAPLLVAGGSAAQRRWGQAVGGRLVGLPLTSLPLLFILVVAQGTGFAARAAVATLAGVTAQAVLTWAYVRVASTHGPVASAAASVAAFALTATALAIVAPAPAVAAVAGTFTLAGLLRVWPSTPGTPQPGAGAPTGPGDSLALDQRVDGRSTTGLRMVLAGGFSVVVSELASPLGPHLAGLITALPVLSLVMFALTQHDDGVAAAQEFAHGVQRGSFSVLTALLVLALALPTGHVVLSFGAAIAASVLTQLVVGVAERHAAADRTDGAQERTRGQLRRSALREAASVEVATRMAWVGTAHARAHPPQRDHTSRGGQRSAAAGRSRSGTHPRGGDCGRQLDP